MLETNEERRGGHFSPHGGFHIPEVLFEFFFVSDTIPYVKDR